MTTAIIALLILACAGFIVWEGGAMEAALAKAKVAWEEEEAREAAKKGEQ